MGRDSRSSILLEYTQDKVVIVDADGQLVYANEAAERILGFSPESLEGTDVFQFIHPEDRDRTRETFRRVIATDDPEMATEQYRFQTTDGSWVWLESRFSNVTDEALGGYVVSSRDVTDQVASDRERDEMAQRLDELTRTIGDVLWMFSGDWEEMLFVNPAFEEIYGMDADRLDEDPTEFLSAVHPDDVSLVEEGIGRLADGEPVDMEYRVNESRDYGTWVWVSAEPIVEAGAVTRIVGFARDITDRRRRERQLAVMDNLLRHNIRNSVSVIVGNAELVARGADETTADRVEIIRRTGEELVESADKQREIIELLTEHPKPRTVDVVTVATGAVESARIRHPDASIETEVPETAPAVTLKEIRLAVSELVDNAVRHADGPADVLVRISESDDRVRVEVHDSGPEIPDTEVGVLTGDHEMTDVYHTTGIGLWLVYWITDFSDGFVTFERRDDGNVVGLALTRADGE